MSFDGNVIRKITNELKETLISGRINKIYQISKTDLLFQVHTKEGKKQLYISNSPNYARIHLTEFTYEKPQTPPTFCMFLRKHLDGGIIEDITQYQNDRVIIFDIKKRNELGDLTIKKMIVESMGRHANIIITDDQNIILEAIKHVMPFDGNERTVFSGATYQFPETSQVDPYQPLDDFMLNPDNINRKAIQSHYMGFSPLASKEIIHRFEHSKESIKTITTHFLNEHNPCIIKTKNKEYFYFTKLDHIKGNITTYPSMNECIDHYYYNKDTLDIVRQQSKSIVTFINSNIKRLKTKIEKLQKQLKKADDRDIYRVKGELIQTYLNDIHKGDSTYTCTNYYNNEEITIKLDPLLSPIENSNQYFKKYKKVKASIPHLKKQIRKAKNELDYFYELEHQISQATLKDIEEIKEELIELRYLKKHHQKSKKKSKPNFDTYKDELGIEIIVGKNNIQNAYITHKLARSSDVWFHVQNAPGSHVIVRHPFPLEEVTIRTASQLASYYSKMRLSSSVPVDYTEARNIKKIPGKLGSFVSYKNQKTIFIDPDEAFIHTLKHK